MTTSRACWIIVTDATQHDTAGCNPAVPFWRAHAAHVLLLSPCYNFIGPTLITYKLSNNKQRRCSCHIPYSGHRLLHTSFQLLSRSRPILASLVELDMAVMVNMGSSTILHRFSGCFDSALIISAYPQTPRQPQSHEIYRGWTWHPDDRNVLAHSCNFSFLVD